MSPVDRLYTGTEPIAHPITGELIALDDREALFKAWTDGENAIRSCQTWMRQFRAEVRSLAKQEQEIREKCDRIVYALAGQDVTRGAARDFAKGD